jgi:hypothetical protein
MNALTCCYKTYESGNKFCSNCGAKLVSNEEQSIILNASISNDDTFVEPHLKYNKTDHVSICADRPLREFLSLIMHTFHPDKYGKNMQEIYFLIDRDEKDNPNIPYIAFTNDFYERLKNLHKINLYYFESYDVTFLDYIFTYEQMLNLLQVETKCYDTVQMFTEQIQFHNITISYMTSRVQTQINCLKQYRDLSMIKPLIIQGTSSEEYLKNCMKLLGVRSFDS